MRCVQDAPPQSLVNLFLTGLCGAEGMLEWAGWSGGGGGGGVGWGGGAGGGAGAGAPPAPPPAPAPPPPPRGLSGFMSSEQGL